MKIIVIASQKGGTGKTTSAVNIGAALAKLQKDTLLIDLDPQANLSQSLGIQSEDTIEELLGNQVDPETAIVSYNSKLDVIPSSIYFDEQSVTKTNQLKNTLEKITEYDFVIIDCPPHLGILTINALMAATDLFTTVKCDYLSLMSILKLEKLLGEIKQHNPKIEFSGIIPTFYYSITLLSQNALKKLKKRYADIVYPKVRTNVSVAEAPISKTTVIDYAPRSHGAKDYVKIAKKMVKKYG